MMPRRFLLAGLAGLSLSHGRALAAEPSERPLETRAVIRNIAAGALDVAYYEVGPAAGPPVLMLHGFPYDAHAYDQASRQLAMAGWRCIVPFLRGYGPTRFLSRDTFRSGQQAALGLDLKAFMDAVGIRSAVLVGYDWGGRAACVVAALWPELVSGLVTCGTAYNLHNSNTLKTPHAFEAERRDWYWFYLSSERGQNALTQDRRAFCRFLWADFSPTWKFDASTFDRSAGSFDNPDFADVVLHSYRYRIGAVAGDPALEDLEQRLASQPVITAPTIALWGADDGVNPPEPLDKVAPHFSQLRRFTKLSGIGHNPPQEAPDFVVQAVRELAT